ncbi:MAG: VOC family protein [Bacteroidaceae bacterium]
MEIKDFCTGIQHIGIPTNDLSATEAFFTQLGFKKTYSTMNGACGVMFLPLRNVVIETYETDQPAKAVGAIDHICLDVKNIDALFEIVKSAGFMLLDKKVNSVPFWSNGIKYFKIKGPNGEIVEFCEIL